MLYVCLYQTPPRQCVWYRPGHRIHSPQSCAWWNDPHKPKYRNYSRRDTNWYKSSQKYIRRPRKIVWEIAVKSCHQKNSFDINLSALSVNLHTSPPQRPDTQSSLGAQRCRAIQTMRHFFHTFDFRCTAWMFHELHFALLLSESFQVSASLLDTLQNVGFLSMTTMVDWYLTSECGCYKSPLSASTHANAFHRKAVV